MRTSNNRGATPSNTPVAPKRYTPVYTPAVKSEPLEEAWVEPVQEVVQPDDSEQARVSAMLEAAFLNMNGPAQWAEKNSVGKSGSQSGKPAKAEKPTKPKKEKPQKDKGEKKSHALLIVSILLGLLIVAVATGLTLIYTGVIPEGALRPAEPTTEPYEPQLTVIAADIDRLYSSPEKSALVDGVSENVLDALYSRLDDAEANGENVRKLREELDTVSRYMRDSAKLMGMESADYDLALENILKETLKLELSADGYSVQGLRDDIYARTAGLLSMRQEYLRIRGELEGVTDYLSFDGSIYKDAINAITHTGNAEELLTMVAQLSAKAEEARAEEAAKATEPSEDEVSVEDDV